MEDLISGRRLIRLGKRFLYDKFLVVGRLLVQYFYCGMVNFGSALIGCWLQRDEHAAEHHLRSKTKSNHGFYQSKSRLSPFFVPCFFHR